MPDTNISVGNQHPVSISPTVALKTKAINGGPSVIYYKNEATVSPTSFTGTIEAGESTVFSTPQWLLSTATGTRLFLEHIPESNTDMATQAELEEFESSINLNAKTWLTLFDANFATLNTYEFAEEQANPERIDVIDDEALGTYAQFEVKEGDAEVAGGHRSELRDGNFYTEGEELLFYIELQRLLGDWTHFNIPMQLHDQSGGSPPLCIMFEENAGRRYTWIGPGNKFGIPTAQWWRVDITGSETAFQKLLYRVKIGVTDGELEVWRNGVRQSVIGGGFVKTGINTRGNIGVYSKCGMYVSASTIGDSKTNIRRFTVAKRMI